MANSSKLAKLALSAKPSGVLLAHFRLSIAQIAQIEAIVDDDIVDFAYASLISYAEAVGGISKHQIAWSIVRLYYSAFYSIRTITLLSRVVPFNCKSEYLLDLVANVFLPGGHSSHRWNWNSFAKVPSLKNQWPYSTDSQAAYTQLREYREDISYRYGFPDPELHKCLSSVELDIAKSVRAYRDDSVFFYTYLSDHLVISYPTKLIYYI